MVHFYAAGLWRRLMNLFNESKNEINKQIIGVVAEAIKAWWLITSKHNQNKSLDLKGIYDFHE